MQPQSIQDVNPADIHVKREIHRSATSSIYEIELHGATYAMKLVSRDLNRFRCELTAYGNLLARGVCHRGFVPFFYGHIDRIDPSTLSPPLEHFLNDKYHPQALILEYLPGTERLNCVNYSEARFRGAVDGIKAIHDAHVHHRDIYPRNILITPDRTVWTDFDVATTFAEMGVLEKEYCEYETALVVNFGEKLKEDQRRGEAPNCKYY
ncbi:hypothetical protein BJY00DRAFT_321673 [Aspergillus carlsbadensis]|nr:hypothetical protein BJY00DRAFT_321673 [Aspergillus carlsbadensis]